MMTTPTFCPVEAAAFKLYSSLITKHNHKVLWQSLSVEDRSVAVHHRAPDGREWYSFINVDVESSEAQDITSIPILRDDEVTITESESEE